MKTKKCLICKTATPSKPTNHLCDDCIEHGKLYAKLKKKRPRRRKTKKRSIWLSFISLDQRIVDEVRFRFGKRFSHNEPRTADEEDFIQQLFLSYTKARKRYNPRHESNASLYTFINRALDRHTKCIDRTRLTGSLVVYLYAEDPDPVNEADWFFVATDMVYEHYRKKNCERKYYQKPAHFSLGLDMACFAEEGWADASSLKMRTAETLQNFSSMQQAAFELLVTAHTQQQIADTLGKSQSWASQQAKRIRRSFGLIPKRKDIS